jgi:uncharacterized membrane protein
MLWSVASEVVEGLWIGFSFLVILCVLIAAANAYLAYRNVREERKRGVYTPLWKQMDVVRVIGTCLFMFSSLLMILAMGRWPSEMEVWLIINGCIELVALAIVIYGFVIVMRLRRATFKKSDG